jgi:hypothetical protein
LLFQERPNLLAVEDDEAENGCVVAQRRDKDGACAAKFHNGAAILVSDEIQFVARQIDDMNDIFPCNKATTERCGPKAKSAT